MSSSSTGDLKKYPHGLVVHSLNFSPVFEVSVGSDVDNIEEVKKIKKDAHRRPSTVVFDPSMPVLSLIKPSK
jgi:hypothetical protein